MTTIETRLAELGVTLPDAAAPVAIYVPYVRTGNPVRDVAAKTVAVSRNA